MDHQLSKTLQDILKTCKVPLQENLTVTPDFWATLSEEIFTKPMVDMFKVGRPDDVSWMLDELPKRGPDAFEKFIDVLNKTGHQSLANMLQFQASVIKAPTTPEPKPPLRAVSFSGCVGQSPKIVIGQENSAQIEEALDSLSKKHSGLRSNMLVLRQKFEEIKERKTELAEVGSELTWRTVSEGMKIKGKTPGQIIQKRARLQDELIAIINEHQYSLSRFGNASTPEDVMGAPTSEMPPIWQAGDDVDSFDPLSCEPLSLNTEVFYSAGEARFGRYGHSESIGMSDQHREILRSQKLYLLKNITATEELWCELARNIFTKNMIDSFRAAATQNQQVSRMLDELPKRGPTAFSDFIEVLGANGHRFVADTLRSKSSSTSNV